jgi:hypothetical protein
MRFEVQPWQASHLPMAIIIVGVGSDSFSGKRIFYIVDFRIIFVILPGKKLDFGAYLQITA